MEAVEAAPPLQQTRGYVPPPVLRRKGQKDNGSVFPSPLLSSEGPAALPLSPTERAIDEELFLRALWGVQSDGGEEDDEDTEADPVLDDLYARKVLQSLHQTSTNHHTDRFLPRYWTPAEEARVHAIYLGSQTRPWYRKMMALSYKASGSSEEESDCDVPPGVTTPAADAADVQTPPATSPLP